MTRRRLLLLALPVALVLLGVGAWVLWPRTAITVENGDRIREGMTRAEVESILGGPERIEATGPVKYGNGAAERTHAQPGMWMSDHALILMHFDDAGQVSG